ncbi:hypothetical protein [Streptomyces sp. RKAG293]|uniref:hypothetical protein n=1 Tax=Streptomyces sp. RKAG293 TaxID=2893403 RepID=UPI0020335795|nr:hypothetical protein [Streptomyces sp. RKAG293]MCM2422178.1 hypothetical protein [Streptomyces sp. RKAG293]
MANQTVEIVTEASAQDAAALFQKSMRVSWVSENITGAGTEFVEPRGSVFDRLDDDVPDFAVVAMLGGRGAEIQKSAVHMYLWDRGDHREITLGVVRNLGALGLKAKSKMRRFIAALEEIDPSVKYTGL